MTALLRTSASLTLILITLASAVAVRPDWASGLGVDCLTDLQRLNGEEDRRLAELERLEAIVQQRVKGRQAATRDLIQGRKNLLETAAAFRELNERTKEYGCRYRQVYPGSTDEERVCRHVIAWVRGELELQSPRLAEELVERLNRELEEHLRRDGVIHLPPSGGEAL